MLVWRPQHPDQYLVTPVKWWHMTGSRK